MSAEPVPERFREPGEAARIALIAESYRELLEVELVMAGDDLLSALWNAPFVILAHDAGDDPRFYFANRAALAAFETELDRIVGSPSRFSAEAPERGERQAMLERVGAKGFIDDYRGIRISAKGRRFEIANAAVWNLIDADGKRIGQAASFRL